MKIHAGRGFLAIQRKDLLIPIYPAWPIWYQLVPNCHVQTAPNGTVKLSLHALDAIPKINSARTAEVYFRGKGWLDSKL